MALSKVGLIDPAIDSVSIRYAANVTGNASVTRSMAVGYTDGRVPQANLDVKGNVYVSSHVSLADNAKLRFGADEDLQIYHNGSHSYISEEGTGQLYLRTNYLSITNAAGSETMTFFDDDGAVTLYYDGVAKLATTGTGLNVTGIGANVTGNVSVTRSLAVGFTDGRVPQANLDVKGNTYISGITTFGSAAIGSTQTATLTADTTLDFDTYQNFVVTLAPSSGSDIELLNPSTESVGQSGVMVFIQDGTGSRTLSLGTDYETAGGAGITLSTAASAVDVVPYFVKAAASIQLGAVQKAFS